MIVLCAMHNALDSRLGPQRTRKIDRVVKLPNEWPQETSGPNVHCVYIAFTGLIWTERPSDFPKVGKWLSNNCVRCLSLSRRTSSYINLHVPDLRDLVLASF